MQQPQGVMSAMASFQPPHITTEQIQKYLDENKKLIVAILDNQNLGKLAECAQYQAQLQKNLMYLAAIADSQPQMPAMPSQMTAAVAQHPVMQPGGYYMPPQGTPMTQQSPDFASKMQMQLQMQFAASPHQQQQQQQLLHQQAMQGQMNVRPGNGMHPMQSEMGLGGVGGSGGQNRQSGHEAGHGSDVAGSSGGGNGGGDEGAAQGK